MCHSSNLRTVPNVKSITLACSCSLGQNVLTTKMHLILRKAIKAATQTEIIWNNLKKVSRLELKENLEDEGGGVKIKGME